MMKKLVVLIASLGLAVQLSGCSLFSSENKSDAEVTADVDSADLEKLEGDEALLAADNSSLASDQLPEDALGESAPKAESQAIAAAPATPAPVETTSNEALPADPFAENTAAAEIAPPPAESNTTIVDSGTTTTPESVPMLESTTTTTTVETPAPKKASASLQKVATAPWKVGKTWFNTVYFARPGDSLASISQMIYGADKTAELKKGNATFKSRSVKPGDKVYYNSPHRPDDSARMITFYEDNGVAPEVYVAKSGDNIRKVSKNLLGYPNAWKEVWATNSIDSKDAIPEGTELHFWKGGNVAAAPAAPAQPDMQMAPPPAQEMPAAPTELAGQAPLGEAPHQAQAEIPPPPPMPEQAPEMAPPPPPPDMAQNQMAPPPPPPPAEAINPPPPPQKKHQMEEAPAGGMDNDTTLALAVVGLAAAGLAGLIVMRKKRKQKEAEQQAMEHTHVGT
ncbi:LPXTG cell wall anchor domain-containing protein [Bdellovibrio svalbardensis]|uniref:LPXTG cell wall anchor domain-containing protein n=1 Tax=Bdellovibrio svalbardensis TaxID=2972972 RepID=A0ABT6DEE8_9BACT|nr:LPXTG cell wall anchor domain-containing protein [Bdellovibrio svalbardensis]MDG0814862.1 LPXTG cell wall anchor domain-containing protein [Bdellovibrio svalbardensis]